VGVIGGKCDPIISHDPKPTHLAQKINFNKHCLQETLFVTYRTALITDFKLFSSISYVLHYITVAVAHCNVCWKLFEICRSLQAQVLSFLCTVEVSYCVCIVEYTHSVVTADALFFLSFLLSLLFYFSTDIFYSLFLHGNKCDRVETLKQCLQWSRFALFHFLKSLICGQKN